jgi:hypothetical protein
MAVLIDTSFVLALFHSRDANHAAAKIAIQSMKRQDRFLPAPVTVELFFMVNNRVNYDRAITALESLRTHAFDTVAPIEDDMNRLIQIMRQYRDAEFDFTDCAIMALAERLNITQVYTFDRRDFSMFVPRHSNHLELLP